MTRNRARYEEIAAHLRALARELPAGSRLPSEAELCERFGVSRMTARQAVQQLVADRLVERRRGAGTFVAPDRVPRLLGSPLSFSASMRRRGLTASSRLIDRGRIVPTPSEAAALRLAPGVGAYVLERLRLADGTPMAIERVVMPLEVAELLGDEIETGSLHDAFERIGHTPSRAVAHVTAQRAPAEHRRLLGLGANGIVLVEERVISDQHDRPLEATRSSYVADRYAFEAVLYGDTEEAHR
jgi:GntR family transcriptional regulator